MEQSNRIVFLDWLRVIACFMVILIHCIEPFYLGGPEGTYVASKSHALWVTIVNSALRAAVLLFVLASSYLLFPLKTDTATFSRKRFVRVLIPFLVWTLLYIFIPPIGSGIKPDVAGGLRSLVFNFVMTSSGHLWFVYMLLGVYLLMPLLSPWIERVSRSEERGFLILWAFTTVLPLIRPIAEAINGSSDLWGECPWNPYGTFYYVSGFIGFPLSAPYETAVEMGTTWNFSTFGVMMQTVAYFLIIRKITASSWFYRHIILQNICSSCGVKLIYTQSLPKAPINGATRWLAGKYPVLQMSGRHKRYDIFWFSFSHETGPLLLHGKKDIFLEDIEYDDKIQAKEKEADDFASRWFCRKMKKMK